MFKRIFKLKHGFSLTELAISMAEICKKKRRKKGASMEEKIKHPPEDVITLINSKIKSFAFNYAGGNYRECAPCLYLIAEGISRYLLTSKGCCLENYNDAGLQNLISHNFTQKGLLSEDFLFRLIYLYLRKEDAKYKAFIDFEKENIDISKKLVFEIYQEAKPFFKEEHLPMLKEMSLLSLHREPAKLNYHVKKIRRRLHSQA